MFTPQRRVLFPVVPTQAALALERVLGEIGPLPREALFLGIATDNLPVLLNLDNPTPGPLLLAADAGAGKDRFSENDCTRCCPHAST